MKDLVLASDSPRRRDLLSQIGVAFSMAAARVDERQLAEEEAVTYVQRLAQAKASAGAMLLGAQRRARSCVLGADTTVVLNNGELLGKPFDRQDGLRMLAQLSGTDHRVLTAVALLSERGDMRVETVVSRVFMRPISAEEAEAYWQSGEPADKAGGYAIQGKGAVFVERIEGDYSAVVGLPLCLTATMLMEAGIPVWE